MWYVFLTVCIGVGNGICGVTSADRLQLSAPLCSVAHLSSTPADHLPASPSASVPAPPDYIPALLILLRTTARVPLSRFTSYSQPGRPLDSPPVSPQTIPFVYSSGGYGFVLNMPGYGHVTVGAKGVGGATWHLDAALGLDFWVTQGTPSGVYQQYADATGHAPMLPEDAMVFWCGGRAVVLHHLLFRFLPHQA